MAQVPNPPILIPRKKKSAYSHTLSLSLLSLSLSPSLLPYQSNRSADDRYIHLVSSRYYRWTSWGAKGPIHTHVAILPGVIRWWRGTANLCLRYVAALQLSIKFIRERRGEKEERRRREGGRGKRRGGERPLECRSSSAARAQRCSWTWPSRQHREGRGWEAICVPLGCGVGRAGSCRLAMPPWVVMTSCFVTSFTGAVGSLLYYVSVCPWPSPKKGEEEGRGRRKR